MAFLCPSPPPAPDYAAAAQAQGAANLDTARAQGHINNPNINNPYGSRNITWNGDQPTITDTLSPDEQSKLDLSNQAQIGTLGALDKYGVPAVGNALQSPYSLPGQATTSLDNKYAYDGFGRPALYQVDASEDGAPGLQTDINTDSGGIPGDATATRSRVEQALYQRSRAQLDPQMDLEQQQLQSQLSNQGISNGSDAFNKAMAQFALQKQTAYGDARDRAISGGGDAMQQDFQANLARHQTRVQDNTVAGQFHNAARDSVENLRLQQQQVRNAAVTSGYNTASMAASLANSGRAQNLQELIAGKTLPINVLDSILKGGQVNNPQFQPYNGNTQVAPPPIFQAAQDQANYGIQSYNAQNAQMGNWLSAASGIGSAYLMGPKPSDRRLKSNIEFLGLRNGHKWYSYSIGGRQDQGVMADEVMHIPGAVHRGADGYLRVDYSKLGI